MNIYNEKGKIHQIEEQIHSSGSFILFRVIPFFFVLPQKYFTNTILPLFLQLETSKNNNANE